VKVYFLGAGASKEAGYPLASELLSELERECKSTSDSSVVEAWKAFSDFRDKAEEPAKTLLTSSNPEIALSLLDLYCRTRELREEDWEKRVFAINDSSRSEEFQDLKTHPFDTEPAELPEAQKAIRGLLLCLRKFFDWRNYLDSSTETAPDPPRWTYLAKELSSLEKGDVVITTNWDSLVERILLEQGRWTPSDGFGFPVNLKRKGFGEEGLPPEFPRESEIRVLKLHGSFGWSSREYPRKLYIRFDGYLEHLYIRLGSRPLFLRDNDEPVIPDHSTDQSVVVYPTFLKRFEHPELQKIWSAAHGALLATNEIQILGYSLPDDDTPVRVLLNSIRGRLERGEVSVIVNDRDPRAGKRWRDFLPNIGYITRDLGGSEKCSHAD